MDPEIKEDEMKPTTDLKKESGSDVARAEETRSMPHYRPNVDILEWGDYLELKADLPGSNADDIDIQLNKGTLTLHAKVLPRQSQDTSYLLREYGIGDFYRSFQVGETVDASKMTAEYSNGVLRLQIPKKEEAKSRKIEVKKK